MAVREKLTEQTPSATDTTAGTGGMGATAVLEQAAPLDAVTGAFKLGENVELVTNGRWCQVISAHPNGQTTYSLPIEVTEYVRSAEHLKAGRGQDSWPGGAFTNTS